MSKWTHSQCERCWNEAHSLMNPIVKRDDGDTEKCCWCGKEHTSGIYVREDPTELMCKGLHEEKDVINDILITTEKDHEKNRIRVCVGAGPDRLVDGWMNEMDTRKLDDILNSSQEYQEKIDAIKALVEERPMEEATYGHDKSKAGA